MTKDVESGALIGLATGAVVVSGHVFGDSVAYPIFFQGFAKSDVPFDTVDLKLDAENGRVESK